MKPAAAGGQHGNDQELIGPDRGAHDGAGKSHRRLFFFHASPPPLMAAAAPLIVIGIEFSQCRFQIPDQGRERPLQRRPAADDDEIVTRTGMNRHHPFRRRPKPPPRPVAADRGADLAANGKSDPKPGPRGTSLIAVLTAPGLHDQPRGNPLAGGALNTQKFPPTLQPFHASGLDVERHGQAGQPRSGDTVTRRDACAPWPAGSRESCGRRRSPCACGIHAGVCGRDCWAERGVSRVTSVELRARCIRFCPGEVNAGGGLHEGPQNRAIPPLPEGGGSFSRPGDQVQFTAEPPDLRIS